MSLYQSDQDPNNPLLNYEQAAAKDNTLQAAMLADDQTAAKLLFPSRSSGESRFLDHQLLKHHGYIRNSSLKVILFDVINPLVGGSGQDQNEHDIEVNYSHGNALVNE